MSKTALNHDRGPVAGFSVGVIVLRTRHALLPGNVQNATTFSFPVIYEAVDVPFSSLMTGDAACDEPIEQAVRKLSGISQATIPGDGRLGVSVQRPAAIRCRGAKGNTAAGL